MNNISDEQIIAALISSRTQGEAASIVGISQRRLYDRMQTQDFKILYKHTRAEILRGTVQALTSLQAKALSVYDEILSGDYQTSEKLKAADAVMKYLPLYSSELTSKENEASAESSYIDFEIKLP